MWGAEKARAAGVYPWAIDSFKSEIRISKDTSVEVRETIQADFDILRKHGIYRTIPVKYKDRYGNNLDIRFELASVTNELGQAINFSRSRKGSDIVIKIGDADRTVSGKQIYVINYRVQRVITQPGEEAELYWNVTGDDWEVPILAASATVEAPEESIRNTICFSGRYGSKEQDCVHSFQGNTAKFAAGGVLNPGEGLTIGTAIDPMGLNLPSFRQKAMWFLVDNWIFGTPLVILLAMLRIYWLKGRDRRYKNIFNENGETEAVPIGAGLDIPRVYAPLKEISAGEAGVLVDEKADMRDITATIIDLARRGFLNIKEMKKEKILSKSKYELSWNNLDESGLKGYELLVLDMLFGRKREAKTATDDLPKMAYFYLGKAKIELGKYLAKQGYFSGDPRQVRGRYWGIAIAIAMSLYLGLKILAVTGLFGTGAAGVVSVISGLIVAFFAPFMPARTAKGRKMLREVAGMREWVRIGAWREQIHEKHNFFEEVLPFAVAFGMTEKFIKAFGAADINNISWYQGSNVFSATSFTSSITNLESAVNSGVAATVPRSAASGGSAFSGGGGGGGGSSGGGFGGGGGGSW